MPEMVFQQIDSSSMLWSWQRTAKAFAKTHGGLPPVLPSGVRTTLGTRWNLGANRTAVEAALYSYGQRFECMRLLEQIESYGDRLEERGVKALTLPKIARDVLVTFCQGKKVEDGLLRRAVEAARALESDLGWKILKLHFCPSTDARER
jgi:hypothetical protein